MDQPDDPSPPTAPGRQFVAMIPDDGREPPEGASDLDATNIWAAATVAWHPALLATSADLPRFEDVAMPTDPQPGDVRLVPAGSLGRIPADDRAKVEAAGALLVEVSGDRIAAVRSIFDRLGPDLPADEAGSTRPELADAVALDFLALGSAHWWLRDLTIAMGHVDTLSRPSLAREVLAGARAWRSGDLVGASNRVRAAFDLLTQARERFYPMDGYVIDFCLLDPNTPAGELADVLVPRSPFTLVASASAIERFALREPDRAAELRAAIDEGWADVAGGPWAELDEPLLPWGSIAWQFAEGAAGYRRHLDDRNVETLARRRFAIYPQLAQVARRFGLRYGWLVALDAGRFPLVVDSKRQWGSPDGSTIESITRPPVAADRPAEALRLAWRMGKSMRDDAVATLPLAHWPSPVAPWFVDFRRSAAFGAVLGRWVTANDFFHYSDRPFEEIKPEPDDLANAYLTQASTRLDPSPIGRRALHHRTRALVDARSALDAFARCLDPTPPERGPAEADPIEDRLERLGADEAAMVDAGAALGEAAGRLAAKVVGDGPADGGLFVFNPLGIPRRAAVERPGAANSADGDRFAVVDLPPFGFRWFDASDPGQVAEARPKTLAPASVRDRVLINESALAAVDPKTGGLRGIYAVGEETPRLGQQLVVNGLAKPSVMRGDRVEVEQSGPSVAQVRSTGSIVDGGDGRPLARFEQVFRLAAGRPTVEIEVRLLDVDAAWLDRIAGLDPWAHHLALRWAWPDHQTTLRRTALLAAWPTNAPRPETPEAIDLTSRQRRTTLLFGGLAHHQRHGQRMLDTILVAGKESARSFRVGLTLDLEYPFAAVEDFLTPAAVVPAPRRPVDRPGAGWLLQVDHKSVAIVRVVASAETNEGRGWGIVVDLIEAGGKPARCRLKAYRDLAHARQVDGHGNHVVDLSFEGNAASVDLVPHEIARVELTFGEHPPRD